MTNAASNQQPPQTFTVRWCPVCGRDDRIQSFKAAHYSRGEICRGAPIEIEYVFSACNKIITTPAATASLAAPKEEAETPPSVRTSIDSIARHIAGSISDYRTDERYAEVIQRASAALIAAAQTLVRATPSSQQIKEVAREIARRINGGENEDLSYPKPLLDMMDDPTIDNEATFAAWLEEIIQRICFSDVDKKGTQ